MEKLMRISKGLDIFFRVMQVLMLIGAVGGILVLLIFHIAGPDDIINQTFHLMDLGPLTFEFAHDLAFSPVHPRFWYMWVSAGLTALSVAAVFYAFHLVRKILHPMTQGRPFESNMGRNIQKIGYVSIVLGIVQNTGVIMETEAIMHMFHLTDLTSGGAVHSITANYRFDGSFLVLFFILLLISHIFQYGVELQRQSDETL